MHSRDKRVDIVKGLGIVFVVLGHTQMALCSFVNLFHVGLFFIASGYCFQEKYTDNLANVGAFFVKRFKRLYLPFVLWNLFYLCFRNLFCAVGIYASNPVSVNELLQQGRGIAILYAGEQLAGACWFVRALFLLEVFFVVVDYIGKKLLPKWARIVRLVVAVIMLGVGAVLSANGTMLPYNLSTVFSAWGLFVIGMELRRFANNCKAPAFGIWLSWVKCLGGLWILALMLQFGTISYDSNIYPNVVFFVAAALLGWTACRGFAELMEKYVPMLGKALVYIGKRTMGILFLHLFFFKLPTLLLIVIKGMPMDNLSAFPVLDNTWWVLYLICGVGGPLLVNALFEKCKSLMGKTAKVICGCVLVLLVVLVPNLVWPYVVQEEQLVQSEIGEMDYSLVYNKEYYLQMNPDVAQALGEDDAVILEHFLTYGVREGRIASENFDVFYYRDMNGDLGDLYGGDLEKYYIHYIQYGCAEGRKGSEIAANRLYECELSVYAVGGLDEPGAEIELLNEQLKGQEFYLFAMPPYCYDVTGLEPIANNKFGEAKVSVKMENLNDKYVIAVKDGDGYRLVSNYAYISNPEAYSTNNVDMPKPRTKKGLQITNSMIEDVEQLNPSFTFMNLIVENIMYPGEVSENVIPYEYKGRTYYFREDEILGYDALVSRLTKADVAVTASVISIKSEGFDELYYPGISMDTHAAFYALNTTDEAGVNYVEAFVTYMSERYNGTDENRGVIANWVVGNEVNESATYNYMGEKEINDYLEEYTRTFRIIYNIVKKNIPEAKVYVPMEPWWGIDSNMLTYGGREFLEKLNRKMKLEGDIDWGVAYHAYSFPLSDPKVLNDTERTTDETGELTLEGYVTTDSIYSVTITMENIEVLTELMHREEYLNADGEVRSIILSEQGYTSNSNLYGRCEAQQAASMVYAYYKSQMSEDIDAFIYFVQRDTGAASLNNNYYLFGLWGENADGSLHKKMSHEVFQLMDTRESLSELAYIKAILGIESWESVIPDFEDAVFESFVSVETMDTTKLERHTSEKDLAEAEISVVSSVPYTGKECLPEITVTYQGVTLVNDVDYDVVYLNNIQPGQAKIVVVGMGKYTGVKEVGFVIKE